MFKLKILLYLSIFCSILVSKYCNAISCTKDSDCNNGVCSSLVCVCNKGYVDSNGVACIYKQKDKLTAFLLSLFLGQCGADWFYLATGNGAYVFAGIAKLFTGLFFVIGSVLLCCTFIFSIFSRDSLFERVGTIVGIILLVLIVLFSLTSTIWYLVDWIRVLTDTFKDGNNIALKDWN